MGYKRNRRSRRLETPSLERDSIVVQVETSSQGNVTLTNVNIQSQESLAENAIILFLDMNEDIRSQTLYLERCDAISKLIL